MNHINFGWFTNLMTLIQLSIFCMVGDLNIERVISTDHFGERLLRCSLTQIGILLIYLGVLHAICKIKKDAIFALSQAFWNLLMAWTSLFVIQKTLIQGAFSFIGDAMTIALAYLLSQAVFSISGKLNHHPTENRAIWTGTTCYLAFCLWFSLFLIGG